MKPTVDWTLYLVADPSMCRGRPVEDVVREAVEGGVSVVQLRNKACSPSEYIAQASRLRALLAPRGVPLIINDRPDVAVAAGADGVHVGQSDMSPAAAGRLMGDDALIGLSVDTIEQVMEAEGLDVDYLGVGPIFATATKVDTSPEWGCHRLADLRARSRHVLVAIGGVNAANAADVIRAGADGIAVVSAICSAPDPGRAAEELRRVIDSARSTPDKP